MLKLGHPLPDGFKLLGFSEGVHLGMMVDKHAAFSQERVLYCVVTKEIA